MNQLDQLKAFSKVVADTGDFQTIGAFQPRDATTNPSLIAAAIQKSEYAPLLDEVLSDGGHSSELSTAGEITDIADRLLVKFGCEILRIVPGRVSTETDARISFDREGIIRQARRLVQLYAEQGVDRERVLIKIASTWEGIGAARLLQREGIRCNLTLLFSLPQAALCAEAGVQLISPFVGRITDWFKAKNQRDYPAAEDPGVQSVQEIFHYYKTLGYPTEVMAASFRNVRQILELAGCDLLTISPGLMAELAAAEAPIERRLSPAAPETGTFGENEPRRGPAVEPLQLDEKKFRFLLNENAMATEKLAEGIRKFVADTVTLEKLISAKLAK